MAQHLRTGSRVRTRGWVLTVMPCNAIKVEHETHHDVARVVTFMGKDFWVGYDRAEKVPKEVRAAVKALFRKTFAMGLHMRPSNAHLKAHSQGHP